MNRRPSTHQRYMQRRAAAQARQLRADAAPLVAVITGGALAALALYSMNGADERAFLPLLLLFSVGGGALLLGVVAALSGGR